MEHVSAHFLHESKQFQRIFQSRCIFSNVPISRLNSTTQIHSTILTGVPQEHARFNDTICTDFFLSKVNPISEPLWLTNQRHGAKSASFHWPEDSIAINTSLPFLTAGPYTSSKAIYFDIDRIVSFLSMPDVTLVTVFIPPSLNFTDFYSTTNHLSKTFLAALVEHIKADPALNATVNFVIVGGTAIAANSGDSIVDLEYYFSSSNPFDPLVIRDNQLQLWLTPGM